MLEAIVGDVCYVFFFGRGARVCTNDECIPLAFLIPFSLFFPLLSLSFYVSSSCLLLIEVVLSSMLDPCLSDRVFPW